MTATLIPVFANFLIISLSAYLNDSGSASS